MPVYRTYVDPQTGAVADEDRAAIDRSRMPGGIARRLLLEREAPAEFVTRFQQTSPPVVAKGVEDTAFYRYGRLLALNDVGGDPGRFGITVDAFHAANAERGARFPHAMLTTNTHDTKRSADVRARIAALTWVPAEWEERVRRWLSITAPLVGDSGAPDEYERYFLFQTLVGAWPIELERTREYMRKALREAKRNSSWVRQNTSGRTRCSRFCERLYSHDEFRSSFDPFVDACRRSASGSDSGAGAEADRAGRPRHLPGRRARVPGAGRPRQPPAAGLGLVPGDARAAAGRRAAGPAHREAVADDAAVVAADPASAGVHGGVSAARSRRRRCRLPAWRRGAGDRRDAVPGRRQAS